MTLGIGVDALDFVKSIPEKILRKIDTIPWDPPYWDPNGKDRGARLNRHKKLDKHDNRFFMDPKIKEKIRTYIEERTNAVWIVFSSDPLKGYDYEHIWFKGDSFGSMSAGRQTRNDEYVYIKTNGKKLNILPGLPRVLHFPVGFGVHMPRRCYKPAGLYNRLYKHINSEFILDPFAGYGMSIKAAYDLGLTIYACDIDETVEWDFKPQYLEVW